LNHEPESPMRTIRKTRLRNSGLDEFRISGTEAVAEVSFD